MEPQIVAALIAGVVALNITIIKGIDFLGARQGKSLPKMYTKIAILETQMKDHLENGPQLNRRLDEINKEISDIRSDVSFIRGKIV